MKLKALCIICAILCVVSVLATGCGSSSEGSVVGTWLTKSTAFTETGTDPDGSGAYYCTFKKDGKTKIVSGSFTFAGKWSYIGDDGNQTDSLQGKIKIEVESVISGTYNVELGTNSEGKKTLTLIDKDNLKLTLTESKEPKTSNKVDDGFKEVDYITGKWQALDNDEVTYTFNSDGTCEITQPAMHVEGSYTVNEKDNVIEVTYLEDNQQNKWNIPFLVKEEEKGEKITFANAVFEKA